MRRLQKNIKINIQLILLCVSLFNCTNREFGKEVNFPMSDSIMEDLTNKFKKDYGVDEQLLHSSKEYFDSIGNLFDILTYTSIQSEYVLNSVQDEDIRPFLKENFMGLKKTHSQTITIFLNRDSALNQLEHKKKLMKESREKYSLPYVNNYLSYIDRKILFMERLMGDSHLKGYFVSISNNENILNDRYFVCSFLNRGKSNILKVAFINPSNFLFYPSLKI